MESSIQTLAQKVPLLTVNAGPRDGAQWVERLKEEYTALIKYVQMNKATGDDWFQISADTTGTKSAPLTHPPTPFACACHSSRHHRWSGRCWFMYNYARYEFRMEFEVC